MATISKCMEKGFCFGADQLPGAMICIGITTSLNCALSALKIQTSLTRRVLSTHIPLKTKLVSCIIDTFSGVTGVVLGNYFVENNSFFKNCADRIKSVATFAIAFLVLLSSQAFCKKIVGFDNTLLANMYSPVFFSLAEKCFHEII